MAGLRLFISYSHARVDVRLRKELEGILEILSDLGIAEAWYDGHIDPGMNWSKEIADHLEAAEVILPLISPDFLASRWCRAELQRAKARSAAGEARLIPVLIRDTLCWKDYLGEFQVLPRGEKPVRQWADRDRAWRGVGEAIRKVAEDLGVYSPPALPHAARLGRMVADSGPLSGESETGEPAGKPGS